MVMEGSRVGGRQFDGTRTKLSSRFMAGRGQVLLEAINKPLRAQEFARRRKLQEMLFKGELKLDQSNIPEELLPLNFTTRATKITHVNEEKKSIFSPRGDLTSPGQPSAYRNSPGFPTLPQSDGWNDDSNHFSNNKQTSMDNPQSNWDIQDKNFIPKNTAKPLRKPEKARRKQQEIDKMSNSMTNRDQGWSLKPRDQQNTKSPWLDWEANVIVHGTLEDEDLPEIAAVEDNDDINDVVVNQYIDALHNESKKQTVENNKLTPQRVQQFSKLKSTSNADCLRVLPGTMPNPPKGDDRWGGKELNGSTLGWGEPVNNRRNDYDDGSSVWSSGGSQYGGIGWSSAS